MKKLLLLIGLVLCFSANTIAATTVSSSSDYSWTFYSQSFYINDLGSIDGMRTFSYTEGIPSYNSYAPLANGKVEYSPVNVGDVIGIGMIAKSFASWVGGKVFGAKAGQMVNVKFDNFPHMEYGMLRVPIRNISLVPIAVNETGKAYILEVVFPEKLITNYGKELTFSQEMTGTAEIITEDLRLLDKFINPIKAVIKK